MNTISAFADVIFCIFYGWNPFKNGFLFYFAFFRSFYFASCRTLQHARKSLLLRQIAGVLPSPFLYIKNHGTQTKNAKEVKIRSTVNTISAFADVIFCIFYGWNPFKNGFLFYSRFLEAFTSLAVEHYSTLVKVFFCVKYPASYLLLLWFGAFEKI